MKHAISMKWLANPHWGHSRIHRMNILFIIKVKILVLVKWSYRSLSITLTIEPRMVSVFWCRSPISFKHMFVWNPVLEVHLTIHPLKYGCLIKRSNQIRHAYYNALPIQPMAATYPKSPQPSHLLCTYGSSIIMHLFPLYWSHYFLFFGIFCMWPSFLEMYGSEPQGLVGNNRVMASSSPPRRQLYIDSFWHIPYI